MNHTDCSLQLFKCLNHLGVSKGIVATRRNVDIAVREADTKLKEWRTQVLKFASMLRHRYIVHFFFIVNCVTFYWGLLPLTYPQEMQ